MEIKFKKGTLVKALCGREYNEYFIILNITENYAYLTNGKSRPIENPKKKNIKHLYRLIFDTSLNDKIEKNTLTNADVIKFLKDYNKSQK